MKLPPAQRPALRATYAQLYPATWTSGSTGVQADVDDRPQNSRRFFTRICKAAICAAGADAAGLTLTGRRAGSAITFSHGLPTEDLHSRLSLIQPGPSHHAAAEGHLVFLGDLAEPESMTRYPMYASTALMACVRSVSVLPLGTAFARLGTIEFYRYRPHIMADERLDAVVAFAAAITDALHTGPTLHDEVLRWPMTLPCLDTGPIGV